MKIKEFFRDVLVKIVANFLWIVLTACWVLFFSNISSTYNFLLGNNVSQVVILSGIIGVGLAFAFISVFLIVRSTRNRYKPVFPRIEYDYIFVDFTFELMFMDRKEIELRSFCILKALKEIKECIRHYHWSGSGNDSPEFMDNPHLHQISEHSMQESGMHYKVNFDSPLYANDETEFSVKIKCYDENLSMHPHHCFRVLKPTEKLTLRLIFNTDLVNTVNRGVYADDGAEIPLEKITPLPVRSEGGLKIYEWVINKPSLLYYYRLDWSFKN